MSPQAPLLSVRCPVPGCGAISPSLKRLTGHLRSTHIFEHGLCITCPLSGCGHTYTSLDGFRHHLEYKHRDLYLPSNPIAIPTTGDAVNEDAGAPEGDFDAVDDGGPDPTPSAAEGFERLLCKLPFLSKSLRLKMEHLHNVPNSDAAGIFDDLLSWALSVLGDVTDIIDQRLDEMQVNDSQLQTFLDVKHVEIACRGPRAGCKATLKALGYVEPKPLDLVALSQGKDQPAHIPRGTPVMHYIPLLKTLNSYLCHPDLMSAIKREPSSNSVDLLSNYTCGSHFKNHPFFSVHPKALRLSVYTDELELCNPLGGNKKKHKICGVYFQVMNIGPKHLSSLLSVHLALLVKWCHVKSFGYEVVLKPLLNDLKKLSEIGVVIKVKGGGFEHFWGAVAVVVGDNLSMHMLGGFRLCFSSGRICRFCLADYSQLSKLKHEGLCTLRTKAAHKRHVEIVAEDPSAESVYGVRGPSPLTALDHVELPDCLPPDIMHDVLEKVMTLNIKIVLKGLHINKKVRYPEALRIISNFKFSVIDGVNKHPDLSPDLMERKVTIKGSAAQKWHLFYFLSLMLGAHVPQDSQFWKLHLLLVQICDIILAVSVSRDMVVQLCLLLTEHHNLWISLVKRCYPPKLHYLLHYARLLLIYGPLRHMWCMRFEAFHQAIKRMSQKCNNFVNPTLTHATRVQRRKCLQFAGGSGLGPRFVIRGKQRSWRWDNLSAEVQDCISLVCQVNQQEYFARVNAVTVYGLLVEEGSFNILLARDGDPVFFKVSEVYVIREEVCVVGKIIFPLDFNEHLHAYRLPSDEPASLTCTLAEELLPAQTLSSYCIEGSMYIKVRFTPLSQ